MLRQPLLFGYCLSKHPVFWLTSLFPTQSVRPPLATYSSLCSNRTYRTPCHARGHWLFPPTLYASATNLRERFFTLRHFLPCTPFCYFQGLSGPRSSPSKAAWLHADLQNIAPACWPLFWITAINKRGTLVGSTYMPKASFEVRVPQPWNLLLASLKPAFLKVTSVDSCLSWRLGYSVLLALIYE